MRGAVVMGSAILLLVASTPVRAQDGLRDRDPLLTATKQIRDDIQKASFHFGPFYLLSRLELADIGFNEPFFVPGSAEEEGGLTVSLRAFNRLYYVPSRKYIFSAEVVPTYSLLVQHPDGSQAGYHARGDAYFLFNHLALDFYGATSDDLRPLRGEINRLSTVRQTEAGVNGELKYSSRTSAIFRTNSRRTEHPEARLQPEAFSVPLLDRSENNHRVSVLHKTLPRTSFTLAAERSSYSFDVSIQKNSDRSYAGGGFVFDSGLTSLTAEAGRATLDFHDPAVRDFSGTVGTLQGSRRVARRVTVNASAARDVDFSIFDANQYYVSDVVRATAEFQTTRDITLRLTLQEGRESYDVPTRGVMRSDRIRYQAAGWTYTLRRLRGGFDLGYFDRDSNIDAFDQSGGIRIVLHLSFTP